MKKAYILAELAVGMIIAALLAGAFTAMGYYINITSNTLKHENSKIILDVIRSRLLHLAKDVDDDGYFELLMHEDGMGIPLEAGISVDAWGEPIYYIAKDFGSENSVDLNYTNYTGSISPSVNAQGRLISKGSNRILETNTTHAVAQGDDLLLEIGTGELNHYKLYGGSEISSQTRGYNSAIVSETAPLSPNIGTLWYKPNDNNMSIYDGSNWIPLE